MGKLNYFTCFFILFFLISQSIPAQIRDNHVQKDNFNLNNITTENLFKLGDFETLENYDIFNYYSKDPEKRIDDKFTIPAYFRESVRFWFNIYTQYNSNFSIIHDKDNLKLVYKILDFSSLNKSKLHSSTKESIQKQFTRNNIKSLKVSLNKLSLSTKIGPKELRILETLKKKNIKVPNKKKEKKAFFKKLLNNIRGQTGQKDKINKGLSNFSKYKYQIREFQKDLLLPKEVIAIPFLESSFNVNAVSKVGAAGVWQFMPFIAKHFMIQSKLTDSRLNPLISTLGALHLLKQNKQILKRWDLAITAYNSGTKHIVLAKKKFKKEKFSLEYMLKKYNHPHVGFAAKNFYSEYLALVFSIAYQEEFFLNGKIVDKKKNKISIYSSLCKFIPKNLYKKVKKVNLKSLNKHILRPTATYPRGTLIVSTAALSKKRYKKIDKESYSKYFPKSFKNLIKNYKCSTR